MKHILRCSWQWVNNALHKRVKQNLLGIGQSSYITLWEAIEAHFCWEIHHWVCVYHITTLTWVLDHAGRPEQSAWRWSRQIKHLNFHKVWTAESQAEKNNTHKQWLSSPEKHGWFAKLVFWQEFGAVFIAKLGHQCGLAARDVKYYVGHRLLGISI